MSRPMGWEHFSHGSDISVRGFERSVGEAFEQAATILTAVAANISGINGNTSVEVRCEAPILHSAGVQY
jgi:SHS2 domain-containing protein